MAASKRYRAAVIGGSGYGGAELIRRLLVHPDVELARVASEDFVGEPLGAAHPSLEGIEALVFERIPAFQAAEGMDVVLLGLPHKVSAEKMPELFGGRARVIDMSGDFRLKDPASYQRYYGKPHPYPQFLGEFVYGLPEQNRPRICAAHYVASPGCFATAVELALLPLARAGVLEGVVHAHGITGSSGSGATPSVGTHHPVRAGNLRAYKPFEHQHVPEIVETLEQAGARQLTLCFVPVSAPLSRGILVTCFACLPDSFTQERLRGLFEEAYASEPFVRVPRKRLPEVAAVSGSNHAEVGCLVGPPARGQRTAALFCAIDNLVKGGAGQAIQNMNLVLGLSESASLEDSGPWPP